MSHECKECVFVASADDIYLSPETRERVTLEPLYIGSFTMPRWSGHARFYVFVCPGCGSIAVDYPHGYDHYGRLFFRCGCGNSVLITNPEIYKAEEIEMPFETVSCRKKMILNKLLAWFVVITIIALIVSKCHSVTR